MQANFLTAILLPTGLAIVMLGIIAIAAGLLNNPEMAIPAAIYSLFAYLTAILTIFYGRRSTQRMYKTEKAQEF